MSLLKTRPPLELRAPQAIAVGDDFVPQNRLFGKNLIAPAGCAAHRSYGFKLNVVTTPAWSDGQRPDGVRSVD